VYLQVTSPVPLDGWRISLGFQNTLMQYSRESWIDEVKQGLQNFDTAGKRSLNIAKSVALASDQRKRHQGKEWASRDQLTDILL
jgi:hypothetical protein